jgi:hypothetical protein
MVEEKQSLNRLFKERGIKPWDFYSFLDKNPIYAVKYARAQEARAELLVEEIIEIADEEVCPQTARNRIDARRWYASKMQPHKYGDRIDLNITKTIDISSALKEAKERIQLPIRYSAALPSPDKPDITVELSDQTAGYKPVDPDIYD